VSPFDAYRDPQSRDLMITFVMRQRAVDKVRAVAALRELNHVGLAHVHQDAQRALLDLRTHCVDYDPCEVHR
jgi:hypothetical protein